MWQSSARECLPIREKACSVDTSGEYQSRFSPIITHRQAIDVYTEQHLEFRRGDHRRRRNRLWPQSMNMNPVLSLFCLAALLLASCGDRQPVKERYDDRIASPKEWRQFSQVISGATSMPAAMLLLLLRSIMAMRLLTVSRW